MGLEDRESSAVCRQSSIYLFLWVYWVSLSKRAKSCDDADGQQQQELSSEKEKQMLLVCRWWFEALIESAKFYKRLELVAVRNVLVNTEFR